MAVLQHQIDSQSNEISRRTLAEESLRREVDYLRRELEALDRRYNALAAWAAPIVFHEASKALGEKGALQARTLVFIFATAHFVVGAVLAWILPKNTGLSPTSFLSIDHFEQFREQYRRDGSGTMRGFKRPNFDRRTIDGFEGLPPGVRADIVGRFDFFRDHNPDFVRFSEPQRIARNRNAHSALGIQLIVELFPGHFMTPVVRGVQEFLWWHVGPPVSE